LQGVIFATSVKIKPMKYFLPRFQDIFFLSVFCGALLLGSRMLSIDSDLGRHLTIGEYILDQRQIPTTDIFSHTKNGESRPPYEWLSQIFFVAAYRLLGLDGVVLLTSLVIASAFALTYADSTHRSGLPVTALLLAILAAAAGSIHWLPRPHVFTFLLLAIWIERLERLRSGEKIPLWQFPILMLFWANLHGGFVFGLLAWAAYFAGWAVERWLKKDLATNEVGKKLLLIGVLSLAASCITPDGWENWRALLGNSSAFILSQTVETMPPDFRQTGVLPFSILLITSILLVIANKFRLPASHLFLLTGFATLGLLMARNIPLFAIVAAPVLALAARNILNQLKAWLKIETRFSEMDHSLRGFTWTIAGILAAVILFSRFHAQTGSSLNQFNANVFPVAAVDWLEENPQTGTMFNEFNWGGYLLHRLWSRQLVFMDSQTDFYGESLTRDYSQIIHAESGWQAILQNYEIDWVIIQSDSPLAHALEDELHWRILYRDKTSSILRK
jgi:hypothetical protein